jgi:hypothetical protein
MPSSAEYRNYAEECRRLARQMPEHRDALLKMALAWTQSAEDAEAEEKKNPPTDGQGKS